MAYVVSVTTRATRDLALVFETIHAESSDAALKWYQGLQEAIVSLEKQPNRCRKTPEDPKLRHLLYGYNHRVYRVDLPAHAEEQTSGCIAHPARRSSAIRKLRRHLNYGDIVWVDMRGDQRSGSSRASSECGAG
jgi:plasmid stabilization system protein ParE